MLRGLTIKENMKGSSIFGGRNLKGYKARGVFQRLKSKKKKKKKGVGEKSRKSKTKKKARNFFILYPNFKRKSLYES